MIVVGTLLFLVILAFVAYRSLRTAKRRRVERSVVVDGLSRRYLAWLPAERGDRDRLPVALAFHPGFGTAEGFEEQVALHSASEAANFIIVYPEGYQKSWNAGTCCGPALRDKIDEVKFVRAILDDLEKVAAIDRRRIYATGWSNGARLCYYLACVMSEEITAIAPISGAVQGPEVGQKPSRPIPVFHVHGLEDRWVPYNGGPSVWKNAGVNQPVERGLEFWRQLAGAFLEARESLFEGLAECLVYSAEDGTKVQLCRIAGLGHHWPGARLVGRYKEVAHMFGPLGPPIHLDQMNGEILHFLAGYALHDPALPRSGAWVTSAQAQAGARTATSQPVYRGGSNGSA